jgi:O-antigen/teichoic acid export membrane protein
MGHSALRRLLKVDSLSGSVGIYVPATALQKAIGLGRLLLFIHLLSQVQYNFWAAGAIIFDIAGPLACLGSNLAISRYVSFFEAQGQLRHFYRQIRWVVLGLCAGFTIIALLGSDIIRSLAIAARTDVAADIDQQMMVCYAAIANILIVSLYLNLIGFLYGLRAYRLVSVLELTSSILLAGGGLAVLLYAPTGLALLLTHAASVLICLIAGLIVLHVALPQDKPIAAASTPAGSLPTQSDMSLLRVVKFGLATLLGTVAWALVNHISYRMTSYYLGPRAGAEFQAFLRLDQQVVFLAASAWAVVFSHVARRWESGSPAEATAMLESSFKALSAAGMTLGVLLYLTLPWWVYIVPEQYRPGRQAVPGLLMFFQVMTNLPLLDILAKLREKPLVTAWALIIGGTINYLLARLWIPAWGCAGAALAGGLGIFAGSWVVLIAYQVIYKHRLQAGTLIMCLMPVILILPVWLAGGIWAVICLLAFFTPHLVSPQEKQMLRDTCHNWRSAWQKLWPGNGRQS